MILSGDEGATIIPQNEYNPELEERVAYFMSTVPLLPKNTRKPVRSVMPTSTDPVEQAVWQREEIRRCKEGHYGMSPKMYFWYNYCSIWDIERGTFFRPDFRVCQQEWFKQIEEVQATKEWGLICVKRRRVGASWLEAADVLHDCMFNTLFKVGMTSKSADDAIELFKKVKFLYDQLPIWIKPSSAAGNTITSIFFGWKDKDAHGNRKTFGRQSEIKVKPPTETGWEGFAIRKWVADEAGKIEKLKQLFSYSSDIMMVGHRRVGTPVIFGTAGDIGKEGKDLMEMWYNADTYKLKQFFFGGWNGVLVDEFGNDLAEETIRWIIYERKRYESLSQKEYNDFLQKYPLTVQEAFTSNEVTGLGNPVKINKQLNSLLENPIKSKRGYFRLDTNKKPIFTPSIKGNCIIYEEPDPTHQNLYIAGCLTPGEKVLTTLGLKNIEDVTYSDNLINELGNPVSINKLLRYNVKNETIYRFKVSNTFRTTEFTGEHPLLVSDDLTNFTFKKVDSVKSGYWTKIPNIYKNPNNFDISIFWDNSNIRVDRQITNPLFNSDFWWVVGLWLGDGWVDKHKVFISFNKSDLQAISKFKRISKELFKRSVSSRQRGGTIECSLTCQQLSVFLTKNFGKFSYGKFLPEWVKHLDFNLKTPLVLGYLDSDGCVTFDKKRNTYSTEFVSVSLELLEGIQDILFSLNIVSSITLLRKQSVHNIQGRICKTKECYHLRLAHNESVKFKNLFTNSDISRKIDKLPSHNHRKKPIIGCFLKDNFIHFKINSIQKSNYTGIVYNFDCQTHTYLCHHITTHNCDPTDHEVKNPMDKDVSSLAMYIVKKRHGLQQPKIVFEYVEKPTVPRDFYDQALIALLYYNNAKILIERNKPGMITYFEENGFKHLMATKPNSYDRLIPGSTWNIGIHMDKKTKSYLEECVEEYIEDYSEFIPSTELLREAQRYGITNCDRVMAFGIALIYLKEDKWEIRKNSDDDNFFKTTFVKGADGVPKRISRKNLPRLKLPPRFV